MFNILFVLIVAMSSVWVYRDATNHKIGKIGEGGFFNLSAGLWASATLLLWIVVFPAYLIKRKSLTELAKQTPVEVSGRAWKTGVLSTLGGLWFLVTLAANTTGNLPQSQQASTELQVVQVDGSQLTAGAVVCETYQSAMKVWAIENTGNPYVNIPGDCVRTSVDLPFQTREDHGNVSKILLGNESIGIEMLWTLPHYLTGY